MSDIAELTESLDLDAALARTYERHDELRHQAAVRRRWTVGGGLAAAAIALAIAVPLSIGSSPTKVHLPAVAGQSPSTTLAPESELPTPTGYTLSKDGNVWTLTSKTPVPSDVSSASGAEASSSATERARVVSSSPGPVLRSVAVQFNCIRLPEQLSRISYELTPDALTIEAGLSYRPDAAACPSGGDGPAINLPLPSALPAGIPVVAGSVQPH